MSEQDDKVKDLIKKAESLSNIGMHKEAIKVLLEANELKPKDYDILRLLGEEYCLYVDTEKGLDYFVEAMELKSNSLSPWIEYAYEYCSICKFDKAEKLILKAIELYPNSFNTYDLYNVLGCLYFKQCKYDKSMDNFIKASKSYIYNYAIWAELEDRCQLKGLYEKSIVRNCSHRSKSFHISYYFRKLLLISQDITFSYRPDSFIKKRLGQTCFYLEDILKRLKFFGNL